MASFKEAVGEVYEEQRSRKLTLAQKPRLVADPCVGIGDLCSSLKRGLVAESTKDIWAIIFPPPSGPQTYSFKTRPISEWMMKSAPLIYEILCLANNT
mgnify:CR=1 FL=1